MSSTDAARFDEVWIVEVLYSRDYHQFIADQVEVVDLDDFVPAFRAEREPPPPW